MTGGDEDVDHDLVAGDELVVEVGAIAGGGGCVAHAPDGRVIFVRHTLPGETVRARITSSGRSFLRADAMEVLAASPDRVDPACPYAGPDRCGGCDFQHVELGAQRRLKAFRIGEQLARLAGVEREVIVEPVTGDVGGLAWRSRVRVAVDRRGAVGLRRHHSHELEYVDECLVARPAVMATRALVTTWPGAAEIEVVTASSPKGEEALVRVTPHGRASPRLPRLDDSIGLLVRGRAGSGPDAVHYAAGGQTYRVTAGVFWQVHVGAADALQQAVLEAAGPRPGEDVADLYAGAGLFAVPLAAAVGPNGSVTAVERDRAACADARHNGAMHAGLRVLERSVTAQLVADEVGTPQIVVLDPAREGAGTEVMASLAAAHGRTARTVVYVSCDPASFGRDARVLLDEGWRLEQVRAFDIFPMTEHVELVAAFAPPA